MGRLTAAVARAADRLADRAAGALRDAADLLEAFGENPFRVRAYRQGAEVLARAGGQVARRLEQGTLTEFPGIGRELAAKVAEVAETGTLSALSELEARVPPEADLLAEVPGVDRKLAIYLAGRLHVKSVSHLRQLAATHMLRTIPWLGAKGEARVRQGLTALTGSG